MRYATIWGWKAAVTSMATPARNYLRSRRPARANKVSGVEKDRAVR